MNPTLSWVAFRRSDATVVIAMVREVALNGDAGEHGEGVEVIVEAPQRGWLGWLHDHGRPGQARIVVTRAGGDVRYPFHVQLVTDHGRDAARLAPALPGWARSDSAGLAFLMQKGRSGGRFDFAGLVGGAVAALSALRSDAEDDGWRAAVDRSVRRG